MSKSQLSLDLPAVVSRSVDDFLISDSNVAAVKLIDSWPGWPSGMAVLVGPRASGKSHLAAIWRERSDAAEICESTPVNKILKQSAHILIEDADHWNDAEAMLHVINSVREAGRTLLLTASRAPARWKVAALADLKSRLLAAPLGEIGDPDEALLAGALSKNFADRQLQPDERVIAYLLLRMPRTFAAARDIAIRLDKQSLVQGRNITVPLARDVLREFT